MTPFHWSVLEILAVAGNLVYTVLMLLEKRVGWLFGIVASGLSIALFAQQQVYAQVGLNAFYVAMGAYGWWNWGRDGSQALPIVRVAWPRHALFIGIGAVGSLLLAYLLGLFPEARFTVYDGFVTAFSLLATWMLAKKYLGNWAYWILADLVAIQLYLLLDLNWYAGLYAVYVLLSISGLLRWRRQWSAQRSV